MFFKTKFKPSSPTTVVENRTQKSRHRLSKNTSMVFQSDSRKAVRIKLELTFVSLKFAAAVFEKLLLLRLCCYVCL